jgi:hypothetical protein
MTHALLADPGWAAVSPRVEVFVFITVNKRNCQPLQGCFPITD